jgi:hypothetical protein
MRSGSLSSELELLGAQGQTGSFCSVLLLLSVALRVGDFEFGPFSSQGACYFAYCSELYLVPST